MQAKPCLRTMGKGCKLLNLCIPAKLRISGARAGDEAAAVPQAADLQSPANEVFCVHGFARL